MKKKTSKIVTRRLTAAMTACICLLLAVACTGCSSSNANTSGYADAKNGVVVVSEYVALDGVEAGIAYGSGFFIGNEGENPQYLVTNHHVIADYLYYGAGQNLTYVFPDGTECAVKSYVRVYFDSKDYVEAYVVGYNEAADVAVLRLASPTDKRKALTLCSPTGDMVGSRVYAIGYPGIADNPSVDSITVWGSDDSTFTSGIISRLTTTSGTGVQSIQIDVTIGHGNSGGPLVNENGSAVGINTWGVMNSNAEEAAYAVNIDEVITLLKLYGVPYVMETDVKQGNVPVIGIIAGVAVLVIVIAVILIIVSGKKKKSAAVSDFPSTTPAANAVSPRPAPSVSNQEDSGYRLQGVSGALEGRRFMIKKNAPLILGRNAGECNVAYPAGTAGVSGKHCQVWYDNGSIYIKDLGSSHGTFVAAGSKLAGGQAVMLKPGERFSLGSGTETMALVQKGGN